MRASSADTPNRRCHACSRGDERDGFPRWLRENGPDLRSPSLGLMPADVVVYFSSCHLFVGLWSTRQSDFGWWAWGHAWGMCVGQPWMCMAAGSWLGFMLGFGSSSRKVCLHKRQVKNATSHQHGDSNFGVVSSRKLLHSSYTQTTPVHRTPKTHHMHHTSRPRQRGKFTTTTKRTEFRAVTAMRRGHEMGMVSRGSGTQNLDIPSPMPPRVRVSV